MGYFLRVVCVVFVPACLSSGSKVQDFAQSVELLESQNPDDEQLILSIKQLSYDTFSDGDIKDIFATKLPRMRDCHEISGKEWLDYGEKIFVKILLLAIQGEMVRAETLRVRFDTRSLLIRTSVVFPFKWIVLLRCIKVSDEECFHIQAEEERRYEEEVRQYEEEVRRLKREYLRSCAMPLKTS